MILWEPLYSSCTTGHSLAFFISMNIYILTVKVIMPKLNRTAEPLCLDLMILVICSSGTSLAILI